MPDTDQRPDEICVRTICLMDPADWRTGKDVGCRGGRHGSGVCMHPAWPQDATRGRNVAFACGQLWGLGPGCQSGWSPTVPTRLTR